MVRLPVVLFFIAALVLAVIHITAIELYLYWRYWWLDIPVHALGGAVVALGVYAAHDFRMIGSTWLRPFRVFLFVFFIALIWEMYEILIGIPMESDYVFDTILDMIMGLIGGWTGYEVGKSVRTLE